MNDLFSKKYVKISIVVIALAAIGFGIYKSPLVQNKVMLSDSYVQKTATVKKGNINFVVSGTGNLYYDRVSVVPSKVSSTVTKVYFNQGDKVKAGDLICELDDKDAALAMSQKTNTLTQSQLSSDAADAEVGKLNIAAPFSGQISNVSVKKGDSIQKGSPVFTIADTSKLKLTVDFSSLDIDKISINQPVEVYLTSMMQVIQGTITYKSNKSASTSLGGQVYSVEVQMDNLGALSEGMPAYASFDTKNGTITSVNTGTLEYVNKTTVTSDTMGTVDDVSIKKNQQVNTGNVVIKIKNDDIVRNKKNGDLNVSNSQIQVESSEEQLGYYKLYAPIDGIISKQNIKIGDTINPGQIVTTIEETNIIQTDIDVDELDIAKVALGQKVTMTVDALPETTSNPIQGEVIKMSLDGTNKNGVISYPVTVRVNERQDILKGGMSVTAKIQVGSTPSVLYLPKKAITRSNSKAYVMPAAKDQKVQNNNQIGERKEVETGADNNEFIEIKTGLKEGDVVVLPEN